MNATFVRSILDYNLETGMFHWKLRPEMSNQWNGKYAGTIAGWLNAKGYRYIAINGRSFRSCRLAWLCTHGHWPKIHIDHINCDRADDRICNLREASNAENMRNCSARATNTSGFKGVSLKPKSGKWYAQIRNNGQKIHLGYRDTPEEAYALYCDASEKLHGKFGRNL